ncbi:glycosyltransferase [Paenibacillus sp. RC67]|uniref:glycosyltransferase n=1 Tax=Paenibacillus sp. RC67 TaxID=3039392 RepID=UPI0024ADC1BB|nr:glycosyltransferase [Paenibacillus sp. RC67]
MKLIIQIPCLNEEDTLAITINDLPKSINGIDEIELLIIDDGSTDRTIEVAKKMGVNHIVKFPRNRGLAEAFKAGMDACLRLGADIIVNTDADNQYKGSDIPKLIQPLLTKKCDIVIGNRQTDSIAHFSPIKKFFQKFGSWIVRKISQTDIPDTTSGFRAYTREAALRINIVSEFTYTLETIIQAGHKKMAVGHVKIGTNGKLRESRLFKSIGNYMKRSANTIIRIYTMYRPLKVFMTTGFIMFVAGLCVSLRYVFYYLHGNGNGHIQSLILAATLMIIGFQVGLIGLVADLISNNRKLLEEALYRVKKMELDSAQTDHSPTPKYSISKKRNIS